MSHPLSRLAVLFLSLGTLAQAEPVLSAAGKKRLAENLKTIDANLADLQENLVRTTSNVGSLQTEIKSLDTLEKDHTELKKKYEDYLRQSRLELQKNSDRLAKMEGKGPAEADKAKSGGAASEKEERIKWQNETQGKVGQVEKLLSELEKNLGDIESRRGPLQSQLKTWSERHKNYEHTIQELTTRKSELEKLANQ